MNRTQRAIKKSCKKSLKYVKQRKNFTLAMLRDSISFCDGYSEELSSIAKEEKGLKGWHRKCVAEYNHSSQTQDLEVGVI